MTNSHRHAGLRAGIVKREVKPIAGQKAASDASVDGLEVATSVAIYRCDAVVRRASALQAHPLNVGPRAMIHPSDASQLGLRDGAIGKFDTRAGTASLPVVVSDQVASGTVWIENGYGATAPMAAGRVQVRGA